MSPFAWQREDNRTAEKRKQTEREIAEADAMGRSDQVVMDDNAIANNTFTTSILQRIVNMLFHALA